MPAVRICLTSLSWHQSLAQTTTRRHGDTGKSRRNTSFSPRLPFSASPRPFFFVANRAHHADIGGATPGSMGMATDVYGEGLRIPPIRLVRNGELDDDLMQL